jgi:hypothetical protein
MAPLPATQNIMVVGWILFHLWNNGSWPEAQRFWTNIDRSHPANRKTPGFTATQTNPVETDVPPLHSQALILVSERF